MCAADSGFADSGRAELNAAALNEPPSGQPYCELLASVKLFTELPAVTAFSTVGFGDITIKTQAARLAVTGQTIADLVILGLAIKIIVGAVSHRQQQPPEAGGASPAEQVRC
jgi:hypothetical protein